MDIKLKEWQFRIENGPNLEYLFNISRNLRTEGNRKINIPMNFDVAMTYEVSPPHTKRYAKMMVNDYYVTKIEQIGEHEFIVEGDALVDILHVTEPYDLLRKPFRARYNAAIKKGTITFHLF